MHTTPPDSRTFKIQAVAGRSKKRPVAQLKFGGIWLARWGFRPHTVIAIRRMQGQWMIAGCDRDFRNTTVRRSRVHAVHKVHQGDDYMPHIALGAPTLELLKLTKGNFLQIRWMQPGLIFLDPDGVVGFRPCDDAAESNAALLGAAK